MFAAFCHTLKDGFTFPFAEKEKEGSPKVGKRLEELDFSLDVEGVKDRRRRHFG